MGRVGRQAQAETSMSDGSNGYGPQGPRYTHQLFVHEVKPGPMGTQVTLVLDDAGRTHTLMVSFPPEDPTWQGKFLNVLEPGAQPLRAATVVAPPGAPILALRPQDAAGNPIADLCCMYRIVQGDWLSDVPAPSAHAVPELVDQKAADRAEREAVEKRLYTEGAAYHCCACGNVYTASDGYAFSDLAGDTVKTLKLEHVMADRYTFVCKGCYQRQFGALGAVGAGALTGAGSFQGLLLDTVRILGRGYAMGLFCKLFLFERPAPVHLMGAGFFGAFLPMETVPGTLFEMAKSPAALLFIFFIPVCTILYLAIDTEMTRAIFSGPTYFMMHMGWDHIVFLSMPLFIETTKGAVAGWVLGHSLGLLDDEGDED